MFRHLISFVLLRAQRPGYARNLPSIQVSGRPGFHNEVWLTGSPCALGFPFVATTHTGCPVSLSCLHSFVFFARAHVHLFAP